MESDGDIMTTEAEYTADHTLDGRCKYPRVCVEMGVHVRPDPLARPRHNTAPDGKEFVWGPIDAVHTVGEYAIVQYREDQSNHSASQPWAWNRHGRTVYHPYLNGRDTNHSYASLDSALVGVIAIKREGYNGQAAEYFDRMTLNVTEEPA
jgi:hypothetical protein